MIIIKLVIVAIISYLLGSCNFGVIISKSLKKEDIRESGSGNAGTTNMMRTYGKTLGILTIIGDIAKVFVAIWLAFKIMSVEETKMIFDRISDNPQYVLKSFAGLFAVAGHIFPCFFKGRRCSFLSSTKVSAAISLAAFLCSSVYKSVFRRFGSQKR